MTIYLFRHAVTRDNLDGVILGASDPPADPGGLTAFAGLARSFSLTVAASRSIPVFSSPLSRAQSSARILSRALGAAMTVLPGLAELSAGDLEGRLRNDVLPPGERIRKTWSDSPPGGESMAAAQVRVVQALARVRESGAAAAALVGHAVVNRVLLKLLAGLGEWELLRFLHPHEAVIAAGADMTVSWLDADGSRRAGLPGTSPWT